jgi:hypothetical protein
MGSQKASPQYQPWVCQIDAWFLLTVDVHLPMYFSADDTSMVAHPAASLEPFQSGS